MLHAALEELAGEQQHRPVAAVGDDQLVDGGGAGPLGDARPERRTPVEVRRARATGVGPDREDGQRTAGGALADVQPEVRGSGVTAIFVAFCVITMKQTCGIVNRVTDNDDEQPYRDSSDRTWRTIPARRWRWTPPSSWSTCGTAPSASAAPARRTAECTAGSGRSPARSCTRARRWRTRCSARCARRSVSAGRARSSCTSSTTPTVMTGAGCCPSRTSSCCAPRTSSRCSRAGTTCGSCPWRTPRAAVRPRRDRPPRRRPGAPGLRAAARPAGPARGDVHAEGPAGAARRGGAAARPGREPRPSIDTFRRYMVGKGLIQPTGESARKERAGRHGQARRALPPLRRQPGPDRGARRPPGAQGPQPGRPALGRRPGADVRRAGRPQRRAGRSSDWWTRSAPGCR